MKEKYASSRNAQSYKWIARKIESLNVDQDFAEIWRLTTTYYVNDFIMNLVYTLGIPAFIQPPAGSVIMGKKTKKAIKQPQKRADDTLQHFWTWFEYGPEHPKMKASLAHVNKGHAALAKLSPGTFPARDVVYTTAWIGVNIHRLRLTVGLSGFTEKQKRASHLYWKAISSQFWSEDGFVENYPENFEEMLAYVENYESESWEKVESGKELTEAIIKQFLDAYFPGKLNVLGRQFYLSFQKQSINDLMQSGSPNPIMKWFFHKIFWLGVTLQEKYLPDPKLSTPEKARKKKIRPAQHIDPPSSCIARNIDSQLLNRNENDGKSQGCPFS